MSRRAAAVLALVGLLVHTLIARVSGASALALFFRSLSPQQCRALLATLDGRQRELLARCLELDSAAREAFARLGVVAAANGAPRGEVAS